MTEALKVALNGLGSLLFWGVLLYMVGAYFVPRSCEHGCSSCPWDRDGERRQRYWTWRVRLLTLSVLLDAGYTIFCLGRVVCDLVLGEVAWTLPVLLGIGLWMVSVYLEDLRELDRARARREELRS